MRPSADTAVASCIIKPAPPTARLPKCTKCQSFATPSTAEYWHMGEITNLLFSVTLFIVKGENNNDIIKIVVYGKDISTIYKLLDTSLLDWKCFSDKFLAFNYIKKKLLVKFLFYYFIESCK